ncbi:NAD-binding protein [Mycobacterium sp. OAE908]|uniref:NAD-binding protein n=1 Tax=Mycobacterium sp. OAE908 TaxID=2817899 RepID=UPI001AE73474
MRRLRAGVHFLIDYRWVLLSIAGALAFIFGCIGYAQFLNHQYLLKAYDAPPDLADVVYRSLMLFLPATAPDKTRLPIWLDIARFLAPAVAGYAALAGLASLFRDRFQQIRVPLMRGHVVVCGLGYVGTVFLRHLREPHGRRKSHVKVVAVEMDPTNPHIELCRSLKIPVIVGDAQLERTLRAAGVRRAARLVAVCADDAVNTEIVAVGRRLASDRRSGELQCLARIGDPELCALLRIQEANLPAKRSAPVLDFFNTEEIGARLWLDNFPVGPPGSHPHLLISRLDALGNWLVKHAAREWYDTRTDDTPLWVTVIDDHAEDRKQALVNEFPALEYVCRFVCISILDREVQQLPELHTSAGAPPMTSAYVTAYRDEDALEAALSLRHALDAGIPLVVALSRAHGVARLIEDARASGALRSIDVFPTLENVCTTEFVQGGSFELIAVAVHNRWREEQLAENKPAPLWEELDESRRDSSRAQARDIPVKLHMIGCVIAPLRDWGASDFTFDPEEVEKLAIEEHDRWIDERVQAGWRAGPKDPDKKLTEYLIPFNELPDHIAEYDRMFVRSIPQILANAGFQVLRLEKTEPAELA